MSFDIHAGWVDLRTAYEAGVGFWVAGNGQNNDAKWTIIGMSTWSVMLNIIFSQNFLFTPQIFRQLVAKFIFISPAFRLPVAINHFILPCEA